MSVKFSEDVVPLTDLKVNPGRIVKHVAEAHRPVLLTSRGRGVAVMQSLSDYEQAAEGVPEVGDRLVAEIFRRVEVLADNPDIGRIVPEFGQPFLRELIHPPFRIVYRRDPGRARIVRVWRSERLLRLPASAKSQGPAG